MLGHPDTVESEVVYSFSSFRFPEHKSAHLKFFFFLMLHNL